VANAPELTTHGSGEQEKHRAALTSVIAAIFLTLFKLIIGIMTGSLGILAEVAHSGLDLVAAAVTLIAVRLSGRPADERHTYGHGKIENLSALFETVLLLVTCVWIIYEAIQRLFFKQVEVEPSIWGIVVMVVAIAVDWSRSRVLYRAAKKYDSQALEADALHFSTDIWSSTVVIVGLILLQLSDLLALPWLAKADSVAALGVALIVVFVSIQLGRRTIAGLLDEVPSELQAQIEAAVRVTGVADVDRVRVRRSGPDAFADVTLHVSGETTLEGAHEIADTAEAAVQRLLPGADVVVHVEPLVDDGMSDVATVHRIAAQHGLDPHHIRFYDVLGRRSLEMHLELPDVLRLDEAHAQVSALEETLRSQALGVERITTHIEPAGHDTGIRRARRPDEAEVRRALRSLSAELGQECRPHDVQVTQDGDNRVSVSFHSLLAPTASVRDAHDLAERMETRLREQLPDLGRVIIHVEPGPAEREKSA
jgi:cation diffusion facilitator family transporter